MPLDDPPVYPGSLNDRAEFAETQRSGAPGELGRAPTIGGRVGRYTLEELIGSGGMGTVIRAVDTELERAVAIKFVPVDSAIDVRRVVDEARAMARVSHPALVPVFDVGTIDGYLYIVMPLLRDGTLENWLRTEKRSWQAVTERFLRAGRGLAAAHASGLVHRDFKPKNVLLDGRDVMVADFGIAAAPDSVEAIAGTPAYMAPEQASGGTVDARADQFSFCVSFWEGLHGERPRETERGTSGADRRRVPKWLRVALGRGFAPLAEDRWPSLAALLDHIESRWRRPRRAALVGVGLALLVGSALAAAQLRPDDGDRCKASSAKLDRVWGPATKSTIQSAFTSTRLPYAKAMAERIVPELDGLAATWREMRIATCQAPRAKLADRNRDLRTRCLDLWVLELEATTRILGNVHDATSLDSSANAARDISPLGDCADDDRLGKAAPPASKRDQVEALEAALLDFDVRRRGAAATDALAELGDLIAQARSLDHAPTIARALRLKVTIHRESSDEVSRLATLEELAKLSAAAADDTGAAAAWLEIVIVLKVLKRYDDARSVLPAASAAVARAGETTALRVRLLEAEAAVLDGLGEGERALALLGQARTLLLEAGADQPGSAYASSLQGILVAIGGAQGNAGDYASSVLTFKNAIRTGEALVGADHPNIARLYANLAESLRRAELYEEALEALRSAERIVLSSVGESTALVRYRAKIASQLYGLGRNAESVQAFETVLPMALELIAPDDPALLSIKSDYSTALREVGRHPEALRLIDEVIAELERRKDTSVSFLLARTNRAGTLTELGRYDEALAENTRAIGLLETTKNAGRHFTRVHLRYGETLLAAGRPAEAIEPLTRASNDTSAGRSESLQRKARWLLGRARVEAKTERSKGLAEVKAARIAMEAAGDTKALAELDAWLAER